MATRIQLRRDTAANWSSANPTLAQGELGLNLDTNQIKIGNGLTAWNSLSYTNLALDINDLDGVTITDAQNGDFLRYNSSASAWINDPVNLSTDTVGDYVQSLTAGTGVNLTNNSGEGSTPTIAIGQAVGTSSSVTFANVTADLIGDVTGNADTATALETARTIQLSGDVSGSVSFDGTANINLVTTVNTASVAIGELYGVNITSPEEFQTLEYNGTEWVNQYASVVSYVRNAEATTITAGTPVYLFGGNGDHASVKRADNTTDATSSKTVGLAGANIAASENGPVITRGYVDGVDLSMYVAGDVLWLGKNGQVTTTKPSAPDHLVFIGVVVRATINGIVYVATQNGYELDELHDVKISGVTDGQFLRYNSASTVWVNDTINLGTDTVGDYVQNLTAGTGVTLTNNSGEGSTPTIAIGQAVATSSSVVFAHILAPVTGSVVGNVTGDLTGNASTASTLQTARTISIAGDVSGSVSFNGSSDVSITATIQPNSVALGTDTTGNYVADVTAGTGISVSHTPGEASSPTVSLNATLDDLSNVLVTTPITGDYLKFNGANWVSASLESSAITVSASAPGSPSEGDLWFESTSLDTFIYYGSNWLQQNTPQSDINELGDLVDVLVTEATPDQILAYNGTEWESTNVGEILNANLSIKNADYVLQLSDKSKTIEMSISSANTVTIPLNSSVAFPVGTEITVLQYGTGKTQIIAENGVTLRYTPGTYLRERFSWAKLVKRASNEWYIYGDLSSS